MSDDATTAGSTFDPERAQWRKSSYSSLGECVVVARCGQQIALRNSNAPEAGILFLERAELAAWIAGIKAGEFDDLT